MQELGLQELGCDAYICGDALPDCVSRLCLLL